MNDDNRPSLKVQDKISMGENSASSDLGRERVMSIIARADEIAGKTDTSEMVQDLLDLMIEVTQADSANFFQLDEGGEELVVTHVRGDVESQYLIGLRLNRKQGYPGLSLLDTKVMVVGDLPSDPDWLRTVDPVNAARKKNVINLPVTGKDRSLGVIQIFNYHQAEIDILTVLSRSLARELTRRKELENVQYSNQRLLTLVDMLGDVAGTLDRNQLLHLVAENAARLVDAERSSLFLINPNTSEMMFQVAYQPMEKTRAGSPGAQNARQNRFSQPGDRSLPKTVSQNPAANSKESEFSYFNRSAITVPLRSDSPAQEHGSDKNHILGGLMVLNQPQASFKEEDAQLMRILANQASTFLQVVDLYEGTEELFLGVIKALVTAMDAKDPYTQGHSQRVSDYSVLIAKELGLNETLVNDIRIGSLLHDIGKLGMPDAILLKNGTLDQGENELMRDHPRTGASILSQVRLLDPMQPAILEHHERLDGSGYPAKLSGKQISWMGRIVAVTDVFDAMTSNRPYRKALSVEAVLGYLNEQAGKLFDPDCVQALEIVLAQSNQNLPKEI